MNPQHPRNAPAAASTTVGSAIHGRDHRHRTKTGCSIAVGSPSSVSSPVSTWLPRPCQPSGSSSQATVACVSITLPNSPRRR